MVEHEDLRKVCAIYHWLHTGRCELLILMQGGTYSDCEVECCEEKCPIRNLVEAQNVL